MSNLNALTGLINSLNTRKEEERKLAAWAKTAPYPVIGYAAGSFGIDCDSRIVAWAEYGKYSEYGWQIDHIVPSALSGSDEMQNLRARHWRGNCSAGGFLGNLLSK